MFMGLLSIFFLLTIFTKNRDAVTIFYIFHNEPFSLNTNQLTY